MHFNEDTAHPDILPPLSETVAPSLIVANGEKMGQSYPLNRFPVRIGRESNADICLEDPTVSKNHARIIDAMGDIILSDMGSTNGVFVNNIKVREWFLRDGDTIRIGDTIFLYSKDPRTLSKGFGSSKS